MRSVALSDVAEPRGLVGGPFGSSLVSRDYVDEGIPVIRGENLGQGRFVAGDHVYVTQEKFDRDLRRNSATGGDIIYTQRGTLGQVAMIEPHVTSDYVVSQSQMRLRVDRAVAVPEFVYYACTAEEFLRQVQDHAIATGVPHINLGILSRLAIPLPVMLDQQAIAEVLGSLDAKIAANTKLALTADELGAAMVRATVAGAPLVSMREVADITMGSSPTGDTLNEAGAGVVFYQGVRDFGMRVPTARVWTTAPTRWAESGDLLVSVRAPVGEVNVAPGRLCIGRGLASVRHRSGYQATLFHLLRGAADVWAPFEAEGTVFGSINRKQLHDIGIPQLPDDDAVRVEREVAALEATVRAALAENSTLASTRDALLPALMSGRLRVRDAERLAEDPGAVAEQVAAGERLF